MKYQHPKLLSLNPNTSAGCLSGSGATTTTIAVGNNCFTGGDAIYSTEQCTNGSANAEISILENCANGPSVNTNSSCVGGSDYYTVGANCTGGGLNSPTSCATGTTN